MTEKTLYFNNPRLLNQLYCARDSNLSKVEEMLSVNIVTREDWLRVSGAQEDISKTELFFNMLAEGRTQGMNIQDSDFENILNSIANGHGSELKDVFDHPLIIRIKNKSIVPKTMNQKKYLQAIQNNDIVLGVGPAGTGKTYLAMAAAIDALLKEEIDRIILTRPAVEAGEALGFLPGDLTEKIHPYLRPLYDAMYAMLGRDISTRLIDRGAIEIAPLAYMRGRTLSNAFVILDEAQNTTPEQMMMFLTRMGDRSRMVITGDITQIDLPNSKNSGLKEATKVLMRTQGVHLFYLQATDVVRNPLVQNIIEAYENYHAEGDGNHRANSSLQD